MYYGGSMELIISKDNQDFKVVVSAQNLVKKYDDFTAVNRVNFAVSQGECFGLLVPNGA